MILAGGPCGGGTGAPASPAPVSAFCNQNIVAAATWFPYYRTMTNTPNDIDTDLYCVRGGCGQPVTHEVTHYNVENDKVVWVYGTCEHHAPAFIMGHNDRVYARFVKVA